MLALRRSSALVATLTHGGNKSLASSTGPLLRALSTKPPTLATPPPPASGKASSPPVPPPSKAPGGPTPPSPSPPPSGGLGVGSALGLIVLAGGTAVTGFYYVLADDKEKAMIETWVADAQAMVGMAPPPAAKPTAPPATAKTPAPAAPAPAKESAVEKIVHDVKEGTAHAKESVKAQIRKAATSASHVVHAVEEKVATAIHGGGNTQQAAVEEVKDAANEAGGVAATVVETAKEAATQMKEAASNAVENAEQLAEQIMADIQERTAQKKEEAATAAAAVASAVEAKKKESTLGKLQTEAALKHFATYENRGKDLRFDTLTRAAEEALAQGEALRKHLEQTLLKDLQSLSPEALQHRVVQLAGELQERTKWEALRLHEAVRKAEVEVSGKYTELIEKLTTESKEELGRQARAMEAEKLSALQELAEAREREFKALLESEMGSFTKSVTAAFEEQRAKDRAEIEAHAKRQVENLIYENQTKYQSAVEGRLEELERLRAQVQALDAVFKTDTDYEHLSAKVHKVTAALMAFELALQTSKPLKKELGALNKVTAGDVVLDAVLGALPKAVEDGVPTLSELQVRFPTVQAAAREAAFVPETSPGMMGHMFGSALAAVTIKPRGLVEGAGADETLARAAYHVERGDLVDAVEELEGLKGLAGKTVQDWLVDAKMRLVVAQAVRAMNARSALLNGSLV